MNTSTKAIQLASGFATFAMLSCGHPSDDFGQPQEAAGISVEQALASSQALLVDLNTNRTCYFENGVAASCWNVGTGRTYNGRTQTQPAAQDYTPTGVYFIHQIEQCPKYFPRGKDPIAPCASNNPLGTNALWFRADRLYGLHGTSQPHLLDRSARRISGGCVRNKNSKIEWLYNKIKHRYRKPTSSWAARTIAKPKSGQAVPVVVGKFNGRYDVGSGSSTGGSQTISKSCTIVADQVNVRNLPNLSSSSVVDRLEQGTKHIHAVEDTGSWYRVEYKFRGKVFNASNKAYVKKSHNGKQLISCQ